MPPRCAPDEKNARAFKIRFFVRPKRAPHEGITLDHARRLIHRIDLLGNPCDLDLLVFFARHPRTLLSSEQIAILLGYEFAQIAASMDVLQRAGLVRQSSAGAAYTARLYAYVGDTGAGWLPDLLELAFTREGRLALVQALRERSTGDRRAVPSVERAPTAEPGPPPDPGPAKRDAAPRPASKKRRKGRTR